MNSFKGIIPPLATPLLEDGDLDINGLEKLIEHVISGGVHGLFILGTTGEGPSLSYSLRVDLIKRVCRLVNGRVPVLVGITDSSFSESVHMAQKSYELGAQGVVAAPPFYFYVNEKELNSYFDQLIERVDLPIFLYNQPSLTKLKINLELVERLTENPKVIGFKDSSSDVIFFHKVNHLKSRSNFSLLIGPEELLMETLLLGADGGIPGGANIFPKLYVSLFDAIQNNNLKEALDFHDKIIELSSIVYSGSGYGSSNVIGGIKKALSCLGICNDYVLSPLQSVDHGKGNGIQKFMSQFK